MALGKLTQPASGGFGRDVPLGRAEHFVAHHELAHVGRPQQRRTRVRVKMPMRVRRPVAGPLVKAHGVRERRFEQVVVSTALSSRYCSAHTSMRVRFSVVAIRANVRSCRGEKQTTRHRPRSLCAASKPSCSSEHAGVSAVRAAKSFSNTKVEW